MNFIKLGGKVLSKYSSTYNEMLLFNISVIFQGFVADIEVSQEKFDLLQKNDLVLVAFTLQADVNKTERNGNIKVEPITVFKPIGISKVDKKTKDFEDLAELELVVLNKIENSMENDKGDKIEWFDIELDGAFAVKKRVSKQVYLKLKEFNNYKVTCIAKNHNRKLLLEVLDWEHLGQNEREFTL